MGRLNSSPRFYRLCHPYTGTEKGNISISISLSFFLSLSQPPSPPSLLSLSIYLSLYLSFSLFIFLSLPLSFTPHSLSLSLFLSALASFITRCCMRKVLSAYDNVGALDPFNATTMRRCPTFPKL
jgi:hypothetical protein